MGNDFLDLETVADILGINVASLSEYVESRRLIANRIAGQLRLEKLEIIRFLQQAELSERNHFPEFQIKYAATRSFRFTAERRKSESKRLCKPYC